MRVSTERWNWRRKFCRRSCWDRDLSITCPSLYHWAIPAPDWTHKFYFCYFFITFSGCLASLGRTPKNKRKKESQESIKGWSLNFQHTELNVYCCWFWDNCLLQPADKKERGKKWGGVFRKYCLYYILHLCMPTLMSEENITSLFSSHREKKKKKKKKKKKTIEKTTKEEENRSNTDVWGIDGSPRDQPGLEVHCLLHRAGNRQSNQFLLACNARQRSCKINHVMSDT